MVVEGGYAVKLNRWQHLKDWRKRQLEQDVVAELLVDPPPTVGRPPQFAETVVVVAVIPREKERGESLLRPSRVELGRGCCSRCYHRTTCLPWFDKVKHIQLAIFYTYMHGLDCYKYGVDEQLQIRCPK